MRAPFLLPALLLALLAAPAPAQIVTDGTVGGRASLNGSAMFVDPALGRRAGGSLIHSFSAFDVQTGAAAAFGLPAGVERVIGRVTGANASTIDGIVSFVDGSFSPVAADFWFFNPNGLTIGANAEFRTSAALRLSAGDTLIFGDGTRLSADAAAPLTITTAAPEAFGFVDRAPGAILLSGGRLPAQGDGIALSGGRIVVDGKRFESELGGDLVFFAGAQGDVADVGAGTGARSTGGTVEFVNGASISTLAGPQGNGSVRVEAGALLIDGSEIGTATAGDFAAGDVRVRATEIDIVAGGAIRSQTRGAGPAGSIRVTGFDRLTLDRAGEVRETAIESEVSEGAPGDASLVLIRGGDLQLLDGGRIFSSTVGFGDAGAIRVSVDTLLATAGGQIGSGALAIPDKDDPNRGARGAGGEVTVRARESMVFRGVFREEDDGSEPQPSGVFSGTEAGLSGPGGDLTVSAPFILLTNEAEMGAETFNASPAGEVQITGGTLRIENGGEITTTGRSTGAAGAVRIAMTDRVETATGAEIASRAPAAGGAAGRIVIRAGSITVGAGSQVTTASGSSDGGAIRLDARGFTLVDSGTVTTSVGASDGDGGAITVTGGLLVLNDKARLESTADQGDGGVVRVATDVTLIEPPDATIDVSSNLGEAGQVQILGTIGAQSAETEAPPTEFFNRFALVDDFCVAAVTGGSALRLAPPERGAEGAAPALFGLAVPAPGAGAPAAPFRAGTRDRPCDPLR
ncbi:MAG: filamentous hemagglutinin N-terminal domain-containing protein [Pikeienuella sp.]|uniref:two-partner secretion domain-containing protein n=1 Tax=Pikeienuella sp. TaxID=2831957 RepID=UPI00391D2B53